MVFWRSWLCGDVFENSNSMQLFPSWAAASRSAAQDFMEPKGLLSCPQNPSTGPHTEPDPVYNTSSFLSEIHFNIILP
jgi:hypothetical protein